jgi:rubrerythrin
MAPIKGSRTEANLKLAFVHEILASRRYKACSARAAADGLPAAAAVFMAAAEERDKQALGNLDLLEPAPDYFDTRPDDETPDNIRLSVVRELRESADSVPAMARMARLEGFDDIAEWFEFSIKASRSHAARLRRALVKGG